jgi:hypothetical protein
MSVNLGGSINKRLAAYLSAAGAIGTAMAGEAEAVVVGTTNHQAFGVNGVVSIDFNQDGQTDFQIDHDRVDLGSGNIYDYLQIDKNDINGEGNPLAFDPGPDATFQATPFSDGVSTRNDANNSAYVITGPQGSYPAALTYGTTIGGASTFDFQESANFQGGGKWIRANRLIDEDETQIDQVLGGRTPAGVQIPFNGPATFEGISSEAPRYVGVQMELNNSGAFNYGWIGLRITNQADATGVVTGWAYETTPGIALRAGVIPEPTGIVTALMGCMMAACFLWRRWIRR